MGTVCIRAAHHWSRTVSASQRRQEVLLRSELLHEEVSVGCEERCRIEGLRFRNRWLGPCAAASEAVTEMVYIADFGVLTTSSSDGTIALQVWTTEDSRSDRAVSHLPGLTS